MGRGKSYHDHSGNQHYQSLIVAKLDDYNDEASGNFEKMCITMNMVKTIQDSGGRFLASAAGGWKELNDTDARHKTGVSFRSRNTKNKTKGTSSGSSLSPVEFEDVPMNNWL
mmetsp:Transcript_43172/g.66337  ORF Transcript_43172/g.66337 Transcript_43172/m.66337 type:complete len:112 (-) Transcript_43172:43-378(-)